MPSLAGMLATSPVPQARSMDPNRPTRRTPLRDRNERRVNEKSENNTEYCEEPHCKQCIGSPWELSIACISLLI
jgi:hypothetical protein